MAQDPSKHFCRGEYFLGGSAYGVCFPFVVSPYKRPGALKRESASLNYALAKTRIPIEHFIGMMKGQYPILCDYTIHLTDESAILRLCKMQRVCFTFHNICISRKDQHFDPVYDSDPEDETEANDARAPYNSEELFSSDELRLIVQQEVRSIRSD